MAPYFFDIDAAAFIGESGRVALRFEAEYELLITQRLILTPDFEINLYGQNDSAVGIGSGLSDFEAGLRRVGWAKTSARSGSRQTVNVLRVVRTRLNCNSCIARP